MAKDRKRHILLVFAEGLLLEKRPSPEGLLKCLKYRGLQPFQWILFIRLSVLVLISFCSFIFFSKRFVGFGSFWMFLTILLSVRSWEREVNRRSWQVDVCGKYGEIEILRIFLGVYNLFLKCIVLALKPAEIFQGLCKKMGQK